MIGHRRELRQAVFFAIAAVMASARNEPNYYPGKNTRTKISEQNIVCEQKSIVLSSTLP